MTTQVRPPSKTIGSVPAGTLTLVLGILFAAAVTFTYVLSLSDTFNPPDWVRVVGLLWLPIGFGGIPVGYYLARSGDERTRARARVGAGLGLVGLVAFAALVIALG